MELKEHNLDSVTNITSSVPRFNKSNLYVDSLIRQYPAYQKAALKNLMEWRVYEWKNVPNPLLATYQGSDFGDYHHVIFKSESGVEYDFGQARNNYGQYTLHELSGQYEDNPEFIEKQFSVYWDWKLTEFLCCDGEFGEAIAFLPTITKLELIKD